MILVCISNNNYYQLNVSVGINPPLSFTEQDFSMEQRSILMDFINLVKSSKANLCLIENYPSLENVEVFITIPDFIDQDAKNVDFSTLEENQKAICDNFLEAFTIEI